ncbi:MAG: helicase HerA-like domain-containing protein [Pseudomonadota bacterium]|nr:helicase HerA-like domain-containing protein [Pseudomonadota bacterium]
MSVILLLADDLRWAGIVPEILRLFGVSAMSTPDSIPASALQDCMAILGRRGSGKSATARGLVEGELRAGHRTCIIDPKGDWWGLRLDADGVSPAFDVPIFGGEHGDVALRPEMGESLGELIATHDLSCVVDLSAFSITDMRRFMRAFAESLYENNRNPLTLVVDEADQLAPQSVPAEMATLLHRMDRLVRMGRKRGLWMWMITQRPAVLNKNLLTQVETLIAMQTTGKTDREAVAGWMEAHSHEGARSVMDTLAKLGVGEGWVWSAGADFLERIQFPMFRTYDSSRTPKHGEVVDAVHLPPIDLDAVKALLGKPETTIESLEAIASKPPESMKDMPKTSIGIRNRDIASFESSEIHRLAERQEVAKLRAQRDALQKRALEAERLVSGMLMAQKQFENSWKQAGEMWGLVHAYAFGADRHLVEHGWERPPSIVNDDEPVRDPDPDFFSEIPGSSAEDTAAASPTPDAAAGVPHIVSNHPGLPKPKAPTVRKLIEAFARAHPRIITLRDAAVAAGASVKSSSWSGFKAELIDGGWIERCHDDCWALTSAALATAFVSDLASKPGANPVETWCSVLQPAHARMLRAIANAPYGVNRQQIAAAANVSPTSSTLGAGITELKRQKLVRQTGQLFKLAERLL